MVPATLLKPLENGIYLLTMTPLRGFWECNGKSRVFRDLSYIKIVTWVSIINCTFS